MLEPVNIVGSGDINREVVLDEVAASLNKSENISVEFLEDAPWQLLIRFEQGGMIILYRTGKYILRGGSSFDALEELKTNFFNALVESDIVESEEQITYSIQNIVFLDEFDTKVDLSKAAVELGLNQTEYEPEQFPSLIYRPDEFELVLLIFTTGTFIITGTTDEVEANQASELLKKSLK
jgi:transcription initiation factor TFIID TATA-box-binding protein